MWWLSVYLRAPGGRVPDYGGYEAGYCKAIAGLVAEEDLNENNILPGFRSACGEAVSKAVKELIDDALGKALPLMDYDEAGLWEKVYKITLDGGMTCPNRDGTLGHGGCFCGAGLGDFAGSRACSVTEQIAAGLSLNETSGSLLSHTRAFTNTYVGGRLEEAACRPSRILVRTLSSYKAHLCRP